MTLVFVLIFNSVNCCWGQDLSEIDRIIAQSKDASQGQMEKLFSKMLQDMPVDHQEQLVLALEKNMDQFYLQETERLSKYYVPQFKKEEEALLYFDTEEKKLIDELKGLKEEIERLKKISVTKSDKLGIYRGSGIKEEETRQVIENISERSKKIVGNLHQLMLVKKLSKTEGIKNFVEWYENILAMMSLMAAVVPPLVIGKTIPNSYGQTVGLISVILTSLFITVPTAQFIIKKLNSPPVELFKKMANSSLLSSRWKKRSWEANLKELGKVDRDFEILASDFMAQAECKNPKIRVASDLEDPPSQIRVAPSAETRFRIAFPSSEEEVIEEIAEEIIPAKKRSILRPK